MVPNPSPEQSHDIHLTFQRKFGLGVTNISSTVWPLVFQYSGIGY
ncbi:uncharacterized protein METZ01_LOCUS183948 [marine metagenome]|uniref:Uncharacterized protein n=1 Tax=marine metagenome TaxID=408172 RepID=A0A382CZ74_9ZZZZ